MKIIFLISFCLNHIMGLENKDNYGYTLLFSSRSLKKEVCST